MSWVPIDSMAVTIESTSSRVTFAPSAFSVPTPWPLTTVWPISTRSFIGICLRPSRSVLAVFTATARNRFVLSCSMNMSTTFPPA